jgi:hypothetical protein
LIVKYRITSDYQKINVRLFDPIYSLCYQEFTNVSTACGGLNTGNYHITGTYGAGSMFPIDGDFGTSGGMATEGNYYMNYTKPIGSINSTFWEVRDNTARVNLTIPNPCWDLSSSVLSLRVRQVPSGGGEWYCLNLTGWSGLRTWGGGSGSVYEEAIWWNITSQRINVTLNSPEDYYNSTSSSLIFNCSGSSSSSYKINNISYWLNGQRNYTLSDGLDNYTSLQISRTINDGEYNWTCSADDNSTITDTSWATNRTFIIDTKKPSISYNSNTETNNSYLNRNWIFVNVSVNDTHLSNVILSFDNTNETFDNNNSYDYWENKTSLSDGIHEFYVWVNDTFGNFNLTSKRKVTIDRVNPIVSFNSPINNSPYNTGSSVFVNVSVTEVNPKNITYSLFNSSIDLINTTIKSMMLNTSNVTMNYSGLSDGIYYINVTVYDLANNFGNSEIRQFYLTKLNLTLNNVSSNSDVELGSPISVYSNSSANVTLCVDINHPQYGTNYLCSSGSENFSFNPDYFRKNILANLSTSTVLNITNGFNYSNFSIPAHKYDEVVNLSVNISSPNAGYVTFYRANTTLFDRAFPGSLIGSNIYLSNFSNITTIVGTNQLVMGNNYQNISFSWGGGETATRYFYLDDSIRLNGVISILMNLTGLEFGVEYESDFQNNYDDIDISQTTADLDESGYILLQATNKSYFIYDDFTNSTIDWTRWGNYTSIPIPAAGAGSITSGSGYISLDTSGTGEYITHPIVSINAAYSKTGLDLLMIDDLKFTAVGDVRGSAYAHSGAVFYIGGNSFFSSTEISVWDSTNLYTNNFNLSFNLIKKNSTHWTVNVSGIEELQSLSYKATCTSGDEVYSYERVNWTSGTYIFWVPSYPACNSSGTVDNSYDTSVEYLTQYAFAFLSETKAEGYSTSHSNIDIYPQNISKWYRSNGTVTSKSVYDSPSLIPIVNVGYSQFTVTNENTSIYVSSNDGTNWEVPTSNPHTFSNPGNNLKWRINLTTNETGYLNISEGIYYVSVNTSKSFPSNFSIDFGGDGTSDLTINGFLNSTNGTIQINLSNANLASVFNVNNSISGFPHLYQIPFKISSATVGTINIDSVNITYNPNPVIIDYSYIQAFLSNSSNGYKNFSIVVGAYASNITIDDVRYDYLGGNKTYTILAHTPDYLINKSLNVTYFYSKWDYNFVPRYVNFLEFIPKSPTSKNISAYGQSNSTPILNITNYGYGGRNTNLSVLISQTNSCVNLTLSLSNNKSAGYILNTSWTNLLGNIPYLNTTNIFMWADFNCSRNNYTVFQPNIYFRMCANNTYCSTEIV